MASAPHPAASEQNSGKMRMILDLRQGGITDKKVLVAMEEVPRDLFVPAPFRDRAYDNLAFPIGYNQTVSQPLVVAMMTQALEIGPRAKVLEIGTGSGYQAAVLSRLCRRVYTIERHRELLEQAEGRFEALRIANITSMSGDGSHGWPDQGTFDRIIVTAAAVDIPEILVNQLAIGGVMVVPVGDDEHDQRLWRVRRTEEGAETEDMGDVRFVPFVPGMPSLSY
jgi:protein-L-isoaspartate(D-aspartate) O-methyltransferase